MWQPGSTRFWGGLQTVEPSAPAPEESSAREFNGTTDAMVLSSGDFAAAPFTFGTIAWLVRSDNSTGFQEILASDTFFHGIDPGGEWYCGFDNSGTATGSAVPEGEWCLVVFTKATGSQVPNYYVYNFTTETWSSGATSGGAQADGSGNPTQINICHYPGPAEHFDGGLAAVAMYRAWVPADLAAVQAAGLHTAADNWIVATTNADRSLVIIPSDVVPATSLDDLTGNGADETSSNVGTVINGPVGWIQLSAQTLIEFTGANDDPWDDPPWLIDISGGTGLADQQDGTGRLLTDTAGSYTAYTSGVLDDIVASPDFLFRFDLELIGDIEQYTSVYWRVDGTLPEVDSLKVMYGQDVDFYAIISNVAGTPSNESGDQPWTSDDTIQHGLVRCVGTDVDVWLWFDGNAKPITPTLTFTDSDNNTNTRFAVLAFSGAVGAAREARLHRFRITPL